MILTGLTLFLLITNDSVLGQIQGFVGQDILLPCNCTDYNRLVWQKGQTIVSVYKEEKSIIAKAYNDRTQLFLEKTNCSLLLFNISTMDTGTFTCFEISDIAPGVSETRVHAVNLTVSSNPGSKASLADKPDTEVVSIAVSVLAVVILAAAVLLLLLVKRRHRRNNIMYFQGRQAGIEEA